MVTRHPDESQIPLDDPFLDALATAEPDDKPFTDEERSAARAGWEECLAGASTPWEDVRRSLRDDSDATEISTS